MHLQAHAARIIIPACIVDLESLQVEYYNSPAVEILGELQDKMNLHTFLQADEIKELKSSLTKDGVYSKLVNLHINKKLERYQIIANKYGLQKAILSFLRINEEKRNYGKERDNQLAQSIYHHQSRAELAEEINQILKLEIKEHKKTQDKLRKTEGYTKSIIGSSLDMIVSLDQKLRIKEFNRTAQKVLVYSREELLNKPVSALLQNSDQLEKIIFEVNEIGSFEGEVTCVKKNKDTCDVFISVTELKSESNKAMGYVCSMRDISEIKESKLKLASTEENYADLFENASDLIQGLDAKGNVLYANKAWKNILGYSEEEAKGLCFFDLISEELRSEYMSYFQGIVKGEKTKTRIWTLLRKDGRRILVESKDNLKYESGKPHSFRSIMRDVTAAAEADRRAQEQQAKIEAIFDSGDIMFWTVNENTALTSFNTKYSENIFRLYGKYPEINNDLSKPKAKFASEQYHHFWEKKYREVLEVGKRVFFQTKTADKFGKVYYREVYLNPIWDTVDQTHVREVAGMALDITDKKVAEKKINEQSLKIKTIFDAANFMIWSVDTAYDLSSFNEYFEKKYAERFGINVSVGDNVIALTKKSEKGNKEEWIKQYERVLDGEKIQFEIIQTDIHKKEHVEEVYLNPIYNEEGIITEIAGIAQTVTFKRTAERKLKDQAAKINAIFDSTAMMIWTVDRNLRIVSYNKVFALQHFKLLGREVSIGSEFPEALAAVVKPDGLSMLKKYFNDSFKGNKQQFEGVIYAKDGQKRWMETFLNPIYLEDERVKEISCLSYEITEKKEIEGHMLESIREKEILLQEVHHRVKNNLQVISSILNLQSSYVKDQSSLDILRESQNRIKSMSFIHESLYQTRDFSRIEFSDYILSLSNNLIHSYSIEAGKIKLSTDFKKVFLSLDQAIPCGLIVNELVSNALKYAFPQGTTGEISLKIKESDNIIRIHIADNGIGLPADLDVEHSESLGLQLVYTLIDQLDATIEVNSEKGTNYLITFEKQ